MCATVDRTDDPDAAEPAVRTPVIWGLVFGAIQAASPLAFWWLDADTVYALGLALIASIYIGFAVADGRPTVIAVESGVATVFVIVAAAAVTGSPWLLVLGLTGHGFQRPLAAPPPVRRKHPLVATVLPRSRLGRRRCDRRRDNRGRAVPLKSGTRTNATAGTMIESTRAHVQQQGYQPERLD